MASFSFDIDPYAVLGVGRDASLEQIRDAYRSKSKKYHPDIGGEEWAFRVLAQAYEVLSTSRVMRATRSEAPPPPPREDPGRARAHAREAPHRPEPKTESVYTGIVDKDFPPGRIVAVELLSIRYLWDQASYLWLNQKPTEDERFLSCSLNVAWPDPNAGPTDLADGEESEILASLSEVFDHQVLTTRAVTSRSQAHDGGFTGWLTYTSFDRTWKSIRLMQEGLHARGLGMRQWSRDLFIPRTWD